MAKFTSKLDTLHSGPYYAVKMVSGFAASGNDGMVVVFDAKTGEPAAFLLDRGFITDTRTGAAGAVAAKYLAKKEVGKVAVIGTGVQARAQLEMLAQVRKIGEVRVWGRDAAKAAAVGGLVAGSVREAVENADIVITVTASRAPLVKAEWLKPGVTVIAVGSDAPDKQELEVGVLKRADRVVADSRQQCLRLGEIHHAVDAGAIASESIVEIGQIISGLKPGRTSENEIIVCDLTGVGVQDVAAASLVVERAIAQGVGEALAL